MIVMNQPIWTTTWGRVMRVASPRKTALATTVKMNAVYWDFSPLRSSAQSKIFRLWKKSEPSYKETTSPTRMRSYWFPTDL